MIVKLCQFLCRLFLDRMRQERFIGVYTKVFVCYLKASFYKQLFHNSVCLVNLKMRYLFVLYFVELN